MIKKWQIKRYDCPSVKLVVISIFIFIPHFKKICLFESIFYIKKTVMSISIMSLLISFKRIIALKCDCFVNACEPAAVSWISIDEKDVYDHKHLASAAGSLLCLSLGGRFGDFLLVRCAAAWLLGNFLIVNCQLSSINETRRTPP